MPEDNKLPPYFEAIPSKKITNEHVLISTALTLEITEQYQVLIAQVASMREARIGTSNSSAAPDLPKGYASQDLAPLKVMIIIIRKCRGELRLLTGAPVQPMSPEAEAIVPEEEAWVEEAKEDTEKTEIREMLKWWRVRKNRRECKCRWAAPDDV